jgi:hypothetical protein
LDFAICPSSTLIELDLKRANTTRIRAANRKGKISGKNAEQRLIGFFMLAKATNGLALGGRLYKKAARMAVLLV